MLLRLGEHAVGFYIHTCFSHLNLFPLLLFARTRGVVKDNVLTSIPKCMLKL